MFSRFTPNLHWTMLQNPVHILHQLVTFVATRGPNAFFLVCILQGRVFDRSSSNSHQIFIGPRSRLHSFISPISDMCGHKGAKFVCSCVHPTGQSFQPIFFKIHTKYSLDQDLDSNPFHHQLVTFVATWGQLQFYCVHST